MSDLNIIEPPKKTVQLAGREIDVRPITVGQIPMVIRALNGVELTADDEGNFDVVKLLEEHTDKVIDIAVILSGVDRKALERVPLDEFALFVGAWLELNADFFARRVLPAFVPVARRVIKAIADLKAMAAAAGAGLTQSSS